jgi:predicted transposase YdaD
MLFTEWKDEEALEYRYEEGRREVWEEGKNEVIKNLLAYGMTAGQISQALKLPLDTVL